MTPEEQTALTITPNPKTVREEVREIIKQRINSVQIAIAKKTLAKTEKERCFWIEVQNRDDLIWRELQSALDRSEEVPSNVEVNTIKEEVAELCAKMRKASEKHAKEGEKEFAETLEYSSESIRADEKEAFCKSLQAILDRTRE